MYDANRIANKILGAATKRGRTLDPLQLVKLVYIAHGFSLAIHGRPLVDEAIEAWRYGPVVPGVYHSAKRWGRDSIKGELPTSASMFGFKYPQDIDGESIQLIDQVADRWGHLSGGALSSWTHRPDSPWAKIYRPGVTGLKIPDVLIKQYFEGIVRLGSQHHV